jgi:hypothetical protein
VPEGKEKRPPVLGPSIQSTIDYLDQFVINYLARSQPVPKLRSIRSRKADSLAPNDLRVICNSLNDEHGTGGQSRLARLLEWDYSTLWRKLNGLSRITHPDELANRQAITSLRASGGEDACHP